MNLILTPNFFKKWTTLQLIIFPCKQVFYFERYYFSKAISGGMDETDENIVTKLIKLCELFCKHFKIGFKRILSSSEKDFIVENNFFGISNLKCLLNLVIEYFSEFIKYVNLIIMWRRCVLVYIYWSFWEKLSYFKWIIGRQNLSTDTTHYKQCFLLTSLLHW